MTDEQLAEYEALLNAASTGPWRLWRKGTPAEVVDCDDLSIGRIWTGPDADLIIAARNQGPALVDEVRTLRGLVRDFLDPNSCVYDNLGYCQTHDLAVGTNPTCTHARARALLADIYALETKEPIL